MKRPKSDYAIQTVTNAQKSYGRVRLDISQHRYHGQLGASVTAIGCANPDCLDVTLSVAFESGRASADTIGAFAPLDTIESYRLRPSHFSKIQPDYIPQPLRDDYTEACKIRDLSPKASATLARRVLKA